jgi:hypothetical protein
MTHPCVHFGLFSAFADTVLQALSQAIKDWPSEIYDIPSLINAIPQPPPTQILMECIADL